MGNTLIADRIPSFSVLTEPERTEMSKIMQVHNFKRKQMVVSNGQVSRHLFYLFKGLLRQYYIKNGREVTEHFTYEGNFCYCLESVFRSKPSKLMMVTVEDSEFCTIPYAETVELGQKYIGIANWLRKYMEDNLILHQKKADSWRFESGLERYKRFMNDFPGVAARASVNDVASYLLMTPESLSRIRAIVAKENSENK